MNRIIGLLSVVFVLGFPSSALAVLLEITGQYTGMVNGSPIDATATGHLDTTGNSLNRLEVEFNSIPSSIHPFIAGNSWNSSYHGAAVLPKGGAVNLFDISGGNYIAGRTVRYEPIAGYESLADDELVLIANVSTDLVAGTINATQEVSGTYSGPIDLIGIKDYQMLWTQIDPTTIEITSVAMIERANGEFLEAHITSVYTGLLDQMPTKLQTGMYRFSNQSFDNNIMSFDWDGMVAPVPEPSSTLSLLALGTLGAASTLKRKLKLSAFLLASHHSL